MSDSKDGKAAAEKEALQVDAIEQRFRLLVEGVRDYAILMLDVTGRISIWNSGAEHLYGYRADEVLGRDLSMLSGVDDAELKQLLERSKANGSAETEGLRVRRDGSDFWAHSVVTYLLDADGVPQGYSEITRDLTERRRHEQELQDLAKELDRQVQERTTELTLANKELESFSYSVAHDLRAPLRSIDGFAKVLVEDFKDLDPEMIRLLQIIARNATKMGSLIDDLLAFSRLSRTQLVTTRVDMKELAQGSFDELRQQNPDKKITLKVGPLPEADADRAMMRQVLTNLLSNAIKFSQSTENIEVHIDGRASAKELKYTIRDYGVGFDMRYVNKLFAPFQRLHRSKDYPGTGIGLALVQRIIHKHAGTVSIDSEPDKGTTVTFTLPLEGSSLHE